MASKKKKRRPGSGPRQGRTGISTQDRQVDAPGVKPAPATPGGPNRLERKEQARKQREAIRRRIARRRFLRRSGVWLGIAVALAAVVFLLVQITRTGELNAEQSGLLADAPAAARAAGCSDVETIQPYSPQDQDRVHIGAGGPPAPPPLSSYPSQPPTSGPHNAQPLSSGEYPDPPPVDQVIHSLEHGAVVIWYDPAALSSQELTDLQTFFNKSGEKEHVIVAPYDYPNEGEAGTLPDGKQMVMAAWHRMETCNNVSLPAAFEFVYHYAARPSSDYRGAAPEAGAAI